MSLNCAEIEKVLDELPLAGSFVQDVVQPSYDSLALSLYSPLRQGEGSGNKKPLCRKISTSCANRKEYAPYRQGMKS